VAYICTIRRVVYITEQKFEMGAIVWRKENDNNQGGYGRKCFMSRDKIERSYPYPKSRTTEWGECDDDDTCASWRTFFFLDDSEMRIEANADDETQGNAAVCC